VNPGLLRGPGGFLVLPNRGSDPVLILMAIPGALLGHTVEAQPHTARPSKTFGTLIGGIMSIRIGVFRIDPEM